MRPPRLRSTVSLLAVLFVAITLLPATPAGAQTDPATAEQQFTSLLNQYRAQRGKPALALDATASQLARNWSQIMGRDSWLRHNPDVAAQVQRWVAPDWQRVGENVGYGWSVESLHKAFYESPGHEANMVGDYNRVGVGVVVTDRIWVTFVFIKAPGLPAPPECRTSGYLVDGYGGVHPLGNAPALGSRGYWPGWNIVRDLSLTPDGKGGQKLDGFGGLWPVGNAPTLRVSGYWRGWDVARAVAVTPDGKGAYVLDAFGGIHAAGNAPGRSPSSYWSGWPVARDIVVDPTNGTRGYVLDAFGGLHPFGGMPPAYLSAYWKGRDVASSVTLKADGRGGYVTTRDGGVHPFAVVPAAMPPAVGGARPMGGHAVGVLMGDVTAVATSVGGVIGTGGAGCARAGGWPDGIARASASILR